MVNYRSYYAAISLRSINVTESYGDDDRTLKKKIREPPLHNTIKRTIFKKGNKYKV